MDSVDFISSMPDDILHHILSFTPTNFAIRTSVLSKRWKHVWYGTSSVSIDCNRITLVRPVDKTIHGFSSSKIMSVHLSICCGVPTLWIDNWIEIATSRKAEDISLVIKAKYKFKDSFFINSDVKKLSVTLVFFPRTPLLERLRFCYDMIPTCTVSWSSLKELSLNTCNLPDESFTSILLGCPMLETLILNSCKKFHHLDLSKSLYMRRLEITFGRFIITQPLEIVAPRILYLKLADCFRPCTLVDVSSLTEAYISLSDYRRRNDDLDYLQDEMLKMLASLYHVEKLTTEGVFLQILSLVKVRGLPLPQLKIKVLIVEMMVVQTIMPGITHLLQKSPGLKKIIVYTKNCKAIADKDLDKYLHTKDLNPFECWCGFFPTVEEKTFSYFNGIAEDAKSEHVASFMELVLRKSETLETMVLNLGGYLGPKEYKKLLTSVPKVSWNKNGEANAIFNGFKITP